MSSYISHLDSPKGRTARTPMFFFDDESTSSSEQGALTPRSNTLSPQQNPLPGTPDHRPATAAEEARAHGGNSAAQHSPTPGPVLAPASARQTPQDPGRDARDEIMEPGTLEAARQHVAWLAAQMDEAIGRMSESHARAGGDDAWVINEAATLLTRVVPRVIGPGGAFCLDNGQLSIIPHPVWPPPPSPATAAVPGEDDRTALARRRMEEFSSVVVSQLEARKKEQRRCSRPLGNRPGTVAVGPASAAPPPPDHFPRREQRPRQPILSPNFGRTPVEDFEDIMARQLKDFEDSMVRQLEPRKPPPLVRDWYPENRSSQSQEAAEEATYAQELRYDFQRQQEQHQQHLQHQQDLYFDPNSGQAPTAEFPDVVIQERRRRQRPSPLVVNGSTPYKTAAEAKAEAEAEAKVEAEEAKAEVEAKVEAEVEAAIAAIAAITAITARARAEVSPTPEQHHHPRQQQNWSSFSAPGPGQQPRSGPSPLRGSAPSFTAGATEVWRRQPTPAGYQPPSARPPPLYTPHHQPWEEEEGMPAPQEYHPPPPQPSDWAQQEGSGSTYYTAPQLPMPDMRLAAHAAYHPRPPSDEEILHVFMRDPDWFMHVVNQGDT